MAELIVTRICILFTLLFIIFFTFNYQGIQTHITIFKDKNKPLAVLNVVIIDLVAVAVLIVVLLIASSLLYSL